MDKLLVTESYKKVLKHLNKAIQVYRDEQDALAIDSLGCRESLNNQLILEKAKLEIMSNLGIDYAYYVPNTKSGIKNSITSNSLGLDSIVTGKTIKTNELPTFNKN